MQDNRIKQFHILDPSPWPLFASFAVFCLLISFILWMHGNFLVPIIISILFVLSILFFWWKDVIKEAIFDKAHTYLVRRGLKIGMILFIVTEIIFFAVFFSSFFKAWLDSVDIIDNFWPTGKFVGWPPQGIESIYAWNIPFINTLILLLSGTTVHWAHFSLINGDRQNFIRGLSITIFLAICFTSLQIFEYAHAHFAFREDGYKSIYSSNFYMATGFHGFHVIIGTIFLIICLFRGIRGQFTLKHHLGFEFATWYWHFVDAVWVFLFIFVYWLSAL